MMKKNEILTNYEDDLIYLKLCRLLRERIISGKFPPGTKLPTESQLQKIFNVSRNTVRHALMELERDDLIVRFPRKGTFVNQAPEGAEKKLKYTVGVSFFSASAKSTFSGPLTQGVLAAANKTNIFIRVVPILHNQNNTEIDGCLFNWQLEKKSLIGKRIAKGILPAVGYNCTIGRKCSVVGVDYYSETLRAIRHLINKGCRKIGYYGRKPDEYDVLTPRFRGYVDALTQAKLDIPEKAVCFADDLHPNYDRAVKYLADNDLDAVFVAMAGLFPQILFAMNHLKISASDIELLCFDDLQNEKLAWPGFHYIRMPLFEIGYAMMESLYQQMLLKDNARIVQKIYPAELVSLPPYQS